MRDPISAPSWYRWPELFVSFSLALKPHFRYFCVPGWVEVFGRPQMQAARATKDAWAIKGICSYHRWGVATGWGS